MAISRQREQPTVLDSFTQRAQGAGDREALYSKYNIGILRYYGVVLNGAYCLCLGGPNITTMCLLVWKLRSGAALDESGGRFTGNAR